MLCIPSNVKGMAAAVQPRLPSGVMYDVIVIGARCAGAALGMLLARRGRRVLLVDRATFPSDIPHGHFIHQHGPRRLQAWGLLEQVAAVTPPVTTETLDLGDFPLTGRDLAVDGIALGYAPRRILLDEILVRAAVDAGAELRQEWTVEDVVADAGRVVGVRGRTRGASGTVSERARLTVGADGRNSRLARLVNAPFTVFQEPLTFWYFTYWRDVAIDGLEIYVKNGRVIFAFPTSHDLAGVFVGWQRNQLDSVRTAIEREYMYAINDVPHFAERVHGGARVERFLGATDVPNFLRQAAGPGWALVGDAGCHKDPFMALGICDAFRDADRLASAIDEGLNSAHLDAALAEYARARDQATLTDFERNMRAARMNPPPAEILQLRQRLRDDPRATREFYLRVEGLIRQPTEALRAER